MLDVITILSLSYQKTTVCSIVVPYLGSLNPQFIDFRAFKVLFRLFFLSVDCWCLFFSSFCSQIVAILGFVSEMLGDIAITSILVWFL